MSLSVPHLLFISFGDRAASSDVLVRITASELVQWGSQGRAMPDGTSARLGPVFGRCITDEERVFVRDQDVRPAGPLLPQHSAASGWRACPTHLPPDALSTPRPLRVRVDDQQISFHLGETTRHLIGAALKPDEALAVAPALATTEAELIDAVDALLDAEMYTPLLWLVQGRLERYSGALYEPSLAHFFGPRLPRAVIERLLACDVAPIRERAILAVSGTGRSR